MRILIVDNDKNITTLEGEITIVLKSPYEFPAIICYPEDADIKSWYMLHDAVLAQREKDSNYEY